MNDVLIICRSPGMRRCGIAHPASATYPVGHWTETQIEQFRADPMFEVREASPNSVGTGTLRDADGGSYTVAAETDGQPVGVITLKMIGEAAVLSYSGSELFRRGQQGEADFVALDVTTQIEIVLEHATDTDTPPHRVSFFDLPDEIQKRSFPEHALFFSGPTLEEVDAASGDVAEGASSSDEVLENGAGKTEPTQDAKPATDVDRPVAIAEVIGSLSDDEKTQTGRPKIAVLEAKLGFRPTSAEIEAALATIAE